MAAVLEKLNWIIFCFVWQEDSKKIEPKSGFFVKFLVLLMDAALSSRIAEAGVVLPDFPFGCVGVLGVNRAQSFHLCMVLPDLELVGEPPEDRGLVHVRDLDDDAGDAARIAGLEVPQVHRGVRGLDAEPVL